MTFAYSGGKRSSSSSRSVSGSFQPVTVPGFAMPGLTAELLQKLPREVDQRVVARAHDDDAVAGLRFCHQRFADLRALGDMFGVTLGRADLPGEPVRSAGTLPPPAPGDPSA